MSILHCSTLKQELDKNDFQFSHRFIKEFQNRTLQFWKMHTNR